MGSVYVERGYIRQMSFGGSRGKSDRIVKEICNENPNEQMVDVEIARGGKAAQIFEIEIEHFSGKEVHER